MGYVDKIKKFFGVETSEQKADRYEMIGREIDRCNAELDSYKEQVVDLKKKAEIVAYFVNKSSKPVEEKASLIAGVNQHLNASLGGIIKKTGIVKENVKTLEKTKEKLGGNSNVQKVIEERRIEKGETLSEEEAALVVIQKAFEEGIIGESVVDLVKAAYRNNYLNRKEGKVGKTYGVKEESFFDHCPVEEDGNSIYVGEVFSNPPRLTVVDPHLRALHKEHGDDLTAFFKKQPLVEFDESEIVPTQRFVRKDNLDRIAKKGSASEAQVLIKDNTNYLVDGHHRAAIQVVKGNKISARTYQC
jgi:hypothetical protein